MKYCPKCKKEYPSDNVQFCNSCGSALIDKIVNESTNDGINNSIITCPSCGKQLLGDQQYCSFLEQIFHATRLTRQKIQTQRKRIATTK